MKIQRACIVLQFFLTYNLSAAAGNSTAPSQEVGQITKNFARLYLSVEKDRVIDTALIGHFDEVLKNNMLFFMQESPEKKALRDGVVPLFFLKTLAVDSRLLLLESASPLFSNEEKNLFKVNLCRE